MSWHPAGGGGPRTSGCWGEGQHGFAGLNPRLGRGLDAGGTAVAVATEVEFLAFAVRL